MKNRGKYILAALCGAAVMSLTIAAGTDAFRMGRGMEVLVNMFRDLSLYYVDEVDPDVLLSDAAHGMTASLDPYTDYISEEDMATFQQMTTGKYGGIGAMIRFKDDYVLFAEPYKDSPADKAGIVIGDKILEIGGKDAQGMTTEQVSALLKGDPGTKIKLKIEKFYTGEIEEISIKREIINIPGIPYYGMVSDSVGYIIHSDFTEDSSGDMRTAIMSLKNQGARSLILDYRNNGGGIMQEAVKILSYFLPKGTEVVSVRGRSEDTNAVFLTSNEPLDLTIPVVVLVNSGSASAAEIVAGALQDEDRAVLVGRRTFGKGLVQSTKSVGSNSYIKRTTAKYYLPSGRCVQAIDYARRNDDGSISHIPDSLISEFRTAGGRKVYDGGGVMPDVKMDAEYVSRFAYIVYGKGYIDDFVDGYMRQNPDMEVTPGSFSLTDEAYSEFVAFMDDKNVEWESETKHSLAVLKEKALQERYIDSISEQLGAIEAAIKDDKKASLMLYRGELADLIENEIVLRKTYIQGVAAHNIYKDPQVSEALNLLADTSRYNEILASKDTDTK